MADKKISQLTGATTPLAGTEVLPIVQSSATVKVSVANLTAGRAVGMLSATAGNVQVSGNTIASTDTNGNLNIAPNGYGEVIIPNSADADAKLVMSGYGAGGDPYVRGYDRTGALNFNLVCDSDVNSRAFTYYGNVIIGTAAKGINFTANTPAAGMTSQLLNWYEEGAFTPVILAQTGTFTTIVNNTATYTRIGRQVTVTFSFVSTNLGTGTFPYISNLPFTVGSVIGSGSGMNGSNAVQFNVDCPSGGVAAYLYKYDGTNPIVVNQSLRGTLTYFI